MEKSKLDEGKKHVKDVVYALFSTNCYQATRYVSPTLVVTATRNVNMKDRKQYGSRTMREGLTLTIGAPNYLQRNFIKSYRKAGVTLPDNVQLRDIPKKRA